MKELSIEKANDGNYKAYTELINRLEDVKNAIKKQNYGIAMDILCKPYPEFQIIASTELKESEDARIRKVLIDYFNRYKEQEECGIKTFFGIPTDNILAWLEKQGEQKLYVNDNAKEMFIKALERVEEQNNKGYKLTDCDKNSWWEDFKAYTSCIIEQNPANKVEPKFHEGDWTVSNLDKKTRQISEVHFDEYNSYYVVNGKSVNLEEYDRLHRLWTIQDAKAGDMLQSGGCTLILDSLTKDDTGNTVISSWYYCNGDKFYGGDTTEPDLWFIGGVHPATKEQRDLLFQKMKEAGYEWDADKKELKKIKQTPTFDIEIPFGAKDSELVGESITIPDGFYAAIEGNQVVIRKGKKPAWSEKDEKLLNDAVSLAYECDDIELRDWFKSIKDRVFPQPKQEWSEEDEIEIQYLLDTLRYVKDNRNGIIRAHYNDEILDRCTNWLKSLKDKIQPKQEWSEQEQVRINRIVACLENLNVADNDILLKDVDWLKSLRPQSQWKPSAFHLECIEDAIAIYEKRGINAIGLKEILEELKKLKN